MEKVIKLVVAVWGTENDPTYYRLVYSKNAEGTSLCKKYQSTVLEYKDHDAMDMPSWRQITTSNPHYIAKVREALTALAEDLDSGRRQLVSQVVTTTDDQ